MGNVDVPETEMGYSINGIGTTVVDEGNQRGKLVRGSPMVAGSTSLPTAKPEGISSGWARA